MARQIDWIRLLERQGIPFVAEGPNTRRGEISVKCPWCGSSDPSEHLGINLSTGYWACWRNMEHRGKSPIRLLKALLKCSTRSALLIAGAESSTNTENFMDRVRSIFNKRGPETSALYDGVLKLPPQFQKINQAEKAALDWLRNTRGFTVNAVKICSEYSLMICRTGEYAGRIVMPIYQDDRLATWTARAFSNVLQPRYKSLEERATFRDKPFAVLPIKSCLYHYDKLMFGDGTLVVTEGVFDAIKLDWYGREFGARATCLFNTDVLPAQAARLYKLRERYSKVVLALDAGMAVRAYKTLQAYPDIFDAVATMPPGIKDPGSMTIEQVRQFVLLLPK